MTVDVTRLGLRLARLARAPAPRVPAQRSGTLIGTTDEGEPVLWPEPSVERAGHTVILAGSGSGKTVMVENALVEEFLRSLARPAPEQGACFLIDPKGDLALEVLRDLAQRAPEQLDRLFFLDPFSAAAFPFNLNRLPLGTTPLDIRAMQVAQLVAEVSTSVGRQAHLGVGARQVDTLQHLALAALDVPDPRANILLALDALVVPRGLRLLSEITRSPRAAQFLRSVHLSDELNASCASRLRSSLAATAGLERLVAAPSCVSFAQLFAPGTITVLSLGNPPGGLTSLSAFFASLVARLAIEHLLERPSPFHGHHVRLCIDEAHLVGSVLAERAELLLTTGRSRGVSLTLICQGTTLLAAASDTLVPVIFTNAPTRIVGRLAAPDAELLARQLAPGRGIDESVAQVRQRFVAAATNAPDRAFFLLTPGERVRFTARPIDIAARERAADVHTARIAAAQTRLALAPDQPRRAQLADLVPQREPRRPRRGTTRPGGSPTTRSTPRTSSTARPRSRFG